VDSVLGYASGVPGSIPSPGKTFTFRDTPYGGVSQALNNLLEPSPWGARALAESLLLIHFGQSLKLSWPISAPLLTAVLSYQAREDPQIVCF